jgi:hypothetical protein
MKRIGIHIERSLSALLVAAPVFLSPVSQAGLLLECATASLGDNAAIIAVKQDGARGSTWILGHDALYLYQPAAPATIKRFGLPNWRYVTRAFACPPDVAIGPDGVVIVSSNIEPTLWRVDPGGTVAVEIPVQRIDRPAEDMGFTDLEVSPAGTVWARGAADRSRWRIDLGKRTAVLISNDR